jgi:hypothetical protein
MTNQQVPSPEVQALIEEYDRLSHAMMTGVGHDVQLRPESTSAKHVRTGINAALVSHAALVRLLMEKRLITDVEYWRAAVEEMRREVERYEQILSESTGGRTSIRLV